MPTIPVITPVRLARITLAGLVLAGMASSGIAMAAGWTGPSSPAPLNNTPELIWNAQETGFTPQDASFNITGSGVLGQFAAGGYAIDPGGIAITAPSLWAGELGAGEAVVFGDLTIDPATGGLTLGGERRTSWPVAGTGDITGISAGSNLVGGGDTGEISLDLSATPTVDGITVNDRVDAARLFVTNSAAIPQIDFNGDGGSELSWSGTFSRLQFASQPHFVQGLTTQVGSTALFSGPVAVNGGYPLTVQGQVAAVSLCALSGTACSGGPHVLGQTISAQTFCIGSDCRTSWPAGGGGGGAVSISAGTGISATPNPITGTGTVSFDQGYGDTRYVNAAGDTMTAAAGYGLGVLRVTNTGAGNGFIADAAAGGVQSAIVGNNSGGGWGLAGFSDTAGGVGVYARGNQYGGIFNSAGELTRTYVASATDGINSNKRIVAPEYCIGASCITSWPAGGGGAYVLRAGDTMTGDLNITGSGSQLNVDSGAIGPAIRGASSGERGVLGVSTSGGLAGVYGSGEGGPGVQGVSNTSYGVLGQTTSGTSGGYFTRGGTWAQLATATDGVATNSNITVTGSGRVTAPQYCIGASCITSWPSGGGSTSITAGTGVTVSPSPITGAGTVSVDTTYLDSRYVNNTGPDQVVGEFAVNSTSGFQTLDVNNTGSGRGARIRSSGANALTVQHTAGGTGAYMDNGTGVYAYIAYGSTYALYGNGSVYATDDLVAGDELRAPRLTVGGVTKTTLPQYTQVTRTQISIPSGWTNAPAGCPAGYKVTGISCFSWDSANNWPGCTSRPAGTQDTLQLYGNGSQVSYTLFCVSGL